MSLIADALQPLLLPSLIEVEGRATGMPLADLIGKQERIGFTLDFDNLSEAVVFDFQDRRPIVQSFSFDCGRFASSAFQSILIAEQGADDGTKLSWSLIEAYYAAFYAAHAVIRIFGHSCTHLDRANTSRIIALAQAQAKHPALKIKSTVYHCFIDIGNPTRVNAKKIREGTGGAHESFWDVFGNLLNYFSEDVLKGPLSQTEAQSVFVKISAAKESLSSRNSPFFSWLSVIRNDVQYRHGHSIWVPCGIRKQDRETLKRLIALWRTDPMSISVGTYQSKPLNDFASLCVFIVAVCRVLLERIAERAPRTSQSFAKLGPLSLIPNLLHLPQKG